jgi:nitrite reductase/ring-hydroxylating ferredoxin subunit
MDSRSLETQPSEETVRHFVTSLSDLAPGERFVAAVGGSSVIVDRHQNGDVVGWWNQCPHLGSEMMPLGRASGGSDIRCRVHRWRFDAENGSCVDVGLPEALTPFVAANLVAAVVTLEDENVWVVGAPPISGQKGLDEI